jgi:hypothetical protein
MPMRPKGRGLVQHVGPPGWLEKSDQAGCDFVRDKWTMPYLWSVVNGISAGEYTTTLLVMVTRVHNCCCVQARVLGKEYTGCVTAYGKWVTAK